MPKINITFTMSKFIDYSYKRLSDDIALILETKVSSDWRCNIWHIQGSEKDLIIDTGLGLWPLADSIIQISEKPIIALCTHSHHDHAGGLNQFSVRSGHISEIDIFANPTRESTVATLIKPEHLIEKPHEGFNIDTWGIKPAPITDPVEEGDIIDLGNRVFKIIHFPGHSPGSIGIWEKTTGIMFTGDTLYDGVLYDHLYHSVPTIFKESLSRLKEFPISTVHAGHGPSFGKEKMFQIIDEYMVGKRSMLCPGKT